jgi:hypothetical protein
MERTRPSSSQPNRQERQLAHLKILSRLLGHELHSQNAPRLSFSREEVLEMQTAIDLFIEEALKSARGSPVAGGMREVEVQAVAARVN